MAVIDPLTKRIRELVESGAYRVGPHAVRHMIEEGFDERQLLEAMGGRLRILEEYPDQHRYLLLGSFHFTKTVVSALHVLSAR